VRSTASLWRANLTTLSKEICGRRLEIWLLIVLIMDRIIGFEIMDGSRLGEMYQLDRAESCDSSKFPRYFNALVLVKNNIKDIKSVC
jgi:hypothetical protein